MVTKKTIFQTLLNKLWIKPKILENAAKSIKFIYF